MTESVQLGAEYAALIGRLRTVVDGMERRWKGPADETVNNGTEDLLTEAGLIQKALTDVEGATQGAIADVLEARDQTLLASAEAVGAAAVATALRRGTYAELLTAIGLINSGGTAGNYIGKTAVAIVDETNAGYSTEYPIVNNGSGSAALDVANRKAVGTDKLRVDLSAPTGTALAGYQKPGAATTRTLLLKLSADVNHLFDHVPASEHNNILNRTPSMDVSSALTAYIGQSVEGEQVNFGRGLMIASEVEYKGRRKYRGDNKESCTIRAPDGVAHRGVFRSDRLVQSNQALGRPVHFQHMTLDAGADQGASGPCIAVCNYRPKLSDMTLRKSASNLILMPNTMDDGTVITFDAVGAMLVSLRLEQAGGDVIKCEGGSTYSDGWAYDLSISGGRNVASLGVGSGWFWNKIHADSIRNSGFVIDTASTLTINDIYMESHGSSPDSTFVALVLINACRSHGITLQNIRGRNNGGVAGVTYAFASLRAATNEAATVSVIGCDYEMKAERGNIGFVLASASGGSLHLKAQGNTIKNLVRPIRRDGTATWDKNGGNSWNRGSAPPVAATVDGVIAYYSAPLEIENTSASGNIDKWLVTESGNPPTVKPMFRDQSPNWAVERQVDGAGPFVVTLGPYKIGRRRQAVGDLVIHMSKFGTDVERCFYSAKLIVKSKEASDPVTRYLKNAVVPTGFSVAPTITVSGTADAFYVTVAFTPTDTGGDGDGSVTWHFVTSTPQ